MEKQILLDKPVRVTWERQTSLWWVGGRIKAFTNLSCFCKSKWPRGIKVRGVFPLGRSSPTDQVHSLTGETYSTLQL